MAQQTAAQLKRELADTLIECDSTADETVQTLVSSLASMEEDWWQLGGRTHDHPSFLVWLLTGGSR